MTYQEAKFIVKEVEHLKYLWDKHLFSDYSEIMPKDINRYDIDKMDFRVLQDIIDNHYGVYFEGDVVKTKISKNPALITHIDNDKAETMHDVKYHILFGNGKTCVIDIRTIECRLYRINNAKEYLTKNIKSATIENEKS